MNAALIKCLYVVVGKGMVVEMVQDDSNSYQLMQALVIDMKKMKAKGKGVLTSPQDLKSNEKYVNKIFNISRIFK